MIQYDLLEDLQPQKHFFGTKFHHPQEMFLVFVWSTLECCVDHACTVKLTMDLYALSCSQERAQVQGKECLNKLPNRL